VKTNKEEKNMVIQNQEEFALAAAMDGDYQAAQEMIRQLVDETKNAA